MNLPAMSSKRTDANRSMRSSVTAFVVMVVAFVVVDLIVMRALQDTGEDGRLVLEIGTQRARSESLAKNALLLIGNTPAIAINRARKEFDWDLDNLSRVHRAAVRADVQKRLRDTEVRDQASLWQPVQQSFELMERSGNRFEDELSRSPHGSSTKEACNELVETSRTYVRSLNEFVEALARQQKNSISSTGRTALFMLAMFILTLIGQAFYIFRPILKRVQASLQQVQALQNQVEAQNGLLSDRNRNLEDQRQALEAQRLELEAKNDRLQASQTRLEEQRAELAQQHRETKRQKENLEQLAESLEKAKELQAQAARRAEELFQGVPVACFSFDRDGVLHAWNRAAEDLYGYAAYEVLWQPMWDALGQSDAEESARAAIERVFDQNDSAVSEWIFHRRDGQDLIVQTTSFPIRDAGGNVVAGIGTTLDLTDRRAYEKAIEDNLLRINEYSQELEKQKGELQEANGRLSALASTDGLTGLTNHRAFQERLEMEFEAAVREGTPLSVVLSDVDNFKKLNDQYGHPAGDRVLKSVAATLREHAGARGVACRYGGEEFVLILPGFTEREAMVMADQVRQAIQDSQPDGLHVTSSFGVASWSSATRSKAEMIAQADKALYKSKQDGRNRVTHAREFMSDEELPLAA